MNAKEYRSFIKKIVRPVYYYSKKLNPKIKLNDLYDELISFGGLDNISDIRYHFGSDEEIIHRNVNVDLPLLYKAISRYGIPEEELYRFFDSFEMNLSEFSLSEKECYSRILSNHISIHSRCQDGLFFLRNPNIGDAGKHIVVKGSIGIWTRLSTERFIIGRTFYRSHCLELCAFNYDSDPRFLYEIIDIIFSTILNDFKKLPVMILELNYYSNDIIQYMVEKGLILVKDNYIPCEFDSRGILNLDAFEKNDLGIPSYSDRRLDE